MSSTKFVFSGRSEKQDGRPWPLIGWGILNFSSETAERNSTTLDRKQDIHVLYQVFQADRKIKMATRPLIGWYIFDFSSETAEQMKLNWKQDLDVLYQVVFFSGKSEN